MTSLSLGSQPQVALRCLLSRPRWHDRACVPFSSWTRATWYTQSVCVVCTVKYITTGLVVAMFQIFIFIIFIWIYTNFHVIQNMLDLKSGGERNTYNFLNCIETECNSVSMPDLQRLSCISLFCNLVSKINLCGLFLYPPTHVFGSWRIIPPLPPPPTPHRFLPQQNSKDTKRVNAS